MAQSIEAGLAGHTGVPAARLIRSWSQKTSTIKQIDTPRRPRKTGLARDAEGRSFAGTEPAVAAIEATGHSVRQMHKKAPCRHDARRIMTRIRVFP
jgi:hypothetical protein